VIEPGATKVSAVVPQKERGALTAFAVAVAPGQRPEPLPPMIFHVDPRLAESNHE
jgi:hypothetical protein